ncbi:MAG TPA: hypothetical protein VK592_02255 [Candidatus Dormibacteraeota bacterium]|nr:hypothetical protein [Candidatus Dormibacteraeota bacterium]
MLRWVRNRQTGPLPRMRRMVRVMREIVRQPQLLPALPAELLRAALAPVRLATIPSASALPPDWTAARAAARERLARLEAPAGVALAADRLRVAFVADTPLAANLSGACDGIALRPEDWQATLATRPLDMLLVESAWAGNGGTWQYRIAWYAHPDSILLRDLKALLAWCAERAVPSVFWDRASRVDGDRFREAAVRFDLIVTADPGRASWYRGSADRRGAGVALLASELGPPRRVHGAEDDAPYPAALARLIEAVWPADTAAAVVPPGALPDPGAAPSSAA